MECDLINVALFSMITYIQGYGIDLATDRKYPPKM